jgi:hypothetical protein
MDVMSTHCTGMDVPKKTVVVCCLTSDERGKLRTHTRTFSTMTADLLQWGDGRIPHESTMLRWRVPANTGSHAPISWRPPSQSWSSMRSTSRPCPVARPMSTMPSGLPTCSATACSRAGSFPRNPNIRTGSHRVVRTLRGGVGACIHAGRPAVVQIPGGMGGDRGADPGVGGRRCVQRSIVVRVVVGLGHRSAVTRGSAEQEKIPNRYVWGADSRGRCGDLRRERGTKNGSECAPMSSAAHGAVWKQEGAWAKETLITCSVWRRCGHATILRQPARLGTSGQRSPGGGGDRLVVQADMGVRISAVGCATRKQRTSTSAHTRVGSGKPGCARRSYGGDQGWWSSLRRCGTAVWCRLHGRW